MRQLFRRNTKTMSYTPNQLGYFKVINFHKPKFRQDLRIKLKTKINRGCDYTQGMLSKGKTVIAEGFIGTFKKKHVKDLSIDLLDDMEILTYTPEAIFTDYKREYSWEDVNNLVLIMPPEVRAKELIKHNEINYFFNEDCDRQKIDEELEEKTTDFLTDFFELMDIASVYVFEESHINPIYEYKFFEEINVAWGKDFQAQRFLADLEDIIARYIENKEIYNDCITKLLLDALVETNRTIMQRKNFILRHKFQSVVNPFHNSLWVFLNSHKFEINSGYIYMFKLFCKVISKLAKLLLFIGTVGICFTKYFPVGIVLAIYMSTQSILKYWKTINIDKLFSEDEILWIKVANGIQSNVIYPKRLLKLLENYMIKSKYSSMKYSSYNLMTDLLLLFKNQDRTEVGSFVNIHVDIENAIVEKVKVKK